MDYRMLVVPGLILFCAGAFAQNAQESGVAHSRLPGAETQGHFQFADHHAAISPLGRLGSTRHARWQSNME
jgi:hypothetical protein